MIVWLLFNDDEENSHKNGMIIIMLSFAIIIIIAIITTERLQLRDVFQVLRLLATQWKMIGISLGLQKHVLDRIKCDEAGVNDRLLEMLSEWLKQVSPPPTWEDLANAVEDIDQLKAQDIRSRINHTSYL